MTRSMTWTTTLLLAFAGLASTGCVSQGQLDSLQTINRQQQERIFALEQQIREYQNSIDAKDKQLAALGDQSLVISKLRASNEEYRTANDDLRKQLAAMATELDKAKQGGGEIVIVEGLPQAVSDALRDLAAANSDLMEYDAKRGMIRLRSDVTFALGSATVNDKAKTALGRLASVLNSEQAAKFDIQVVGHTDAVPVTSARGKQLFVDNLGLSAARGGSVARVLIANRVTASRLLAGGRGATQPIEANNAKGQSRANRRVEIFLVKASDSPKPTPGKPAPDPVKPEVKEGGADPVDDGVFK